MTNDRHAEGAGRSVIVGVLLALAAAASFGITTPIVQRLAATSDPFVTAALLYGGASLFAAVARGRPTVGAGFRGRPLVILALMALCGAFLAPVCLAWGLKRTSGTSASLMLNLEAVFTVALGVVLNREWVGARVWIAVTLIAAGGAVMVFGHGTIVGAQTLGLLAIIAATVFWALDNTLSRHLSSLDPNIVILGKSLAGAAISLAVVLSRQTHFPLSLPMLGLLACGIVGYGLSLRFYLLAQRNLGSARTGSVFATAPFLGALVAWILGEPLGGWPTGIACVFLATGVYLHLSEAKQAEGNAERRFAPSREGTRS